MGFSDYIIYVDESGDANLNNPNVAYPMFILSFCIFNKANYLRDISPAIQKFKFDYFGHDAIILHESDIRKQNKPFVFLKSKNKRDVFMNDLNQMITNSQMTIISAAINKVKLNSKYKHPADPYHLALKFCVERLQIFLNDNNQNAQTTHLVFEKRGKEEDRNLELEFRRIKDGANFTSNKFPILDIIFADKKINSAGLQLADLTARPIGIKLIKPEQRNRAYDIIKQKFYRNSNGEYIGCGLKIFP